MQRNSNTTVVAAVISAVLSLGASAAATAAESGFRAMLKPLKGLSFDIGNQHAVSYFTNDNGRCSIVLTHSAEPAFDEANSFVVTRFEATLAAGKSTRYRFAGDAVFFQCEAGAQAMDVMAIKQIATSQDR